MGNRNLGSHPLGDGFCITLYRHWFRGAARGGRRHSGSHNFCGRNEGRSDRRRQKKQRLSKLRVCHGGVGKEFGLNEFPRRKLPCSASVYQAKILLGPFKFLAPLARCSLNFYRRLHQTKNSPQRLVDCGTFGAAKDTLKVLQKLGTRE